MEIIFPKVDLKPTKLSEVKAGELFIEDLNDINNEKSYMLKLGFEEKDSKIFSIFILNKDQPTVYRKDGDRFVYVIKNNFSVTLNTGNCILNSVKQQSIFMFEDSNSINVTIYLKTDKSKDEDIGIIEIGTFSFAESNSVLNFSGEKIVYKEGNRKIRTFDVQFKLSFGENQWFSLKIKRGILCFFF